MDNKVYAAPIVKRRRQKAEHYVPDPSKKPKAATYILLVSLKRTGSASLESSEVPVLKLRLQT